MATAKNRPFAMDSLTAGIWLPAFLITMLNVGLFWALFAGIGGR
jgi:hypothetical protein